jgi:hypothetical protein
MKEVFNPGKPARTKSLGPGDRNPGKGFSCHSERSEESLFFHMLPP